MDKTQRAQMLRQRFKAIGRFPFVGTSRKPKQEPKPKRTYFPSDGFGLLRNSTLNKWVIRPDPKPSATPTVKHNQGKSAVGRVAKLAAPAKLARAFATAEGLLAARARR